MYVGKDWTHSKSMVSSSWEDQGVTSELNLNDCQILKGYVGASQAVHQLLQKPSSFRK